MDGCIRWLAVLHKEGVNRMYYTSPSTKKTDYGHIKEARKSAISYLKKPFRKNATVNVYERKRGLQGQVYSIVYMNRRYFAYRSNKGIDYEINKDGTLKR